MMIKYRVSDVAKDFGKPNKEIAEILGAYLQAPKSNAQALKEPELDVIFEYLTQQNQAESLDAQVEALIAQRQQARKEQNFALADQIRDQLKAQGIVLEDTPQGVKWSVQK